MQFPPEASSEYSKSSNIWGNYALILDSEQIQYRFDLYSFWLGTRKHSVVSGFLWRLNCVRFNSSKSDSNKISKYPNENSEIYGINTNDAGKILIIQLQLIMKEVHCSNCPYSRLYACFLYGTFNSDIIRILSEVLIDNNAIIWNFCPHCFSYGTQRIIKKCWVIWIGGM